MTAHILSDNSTEYLAECGRKNKGKTDFTKAKSSICRTIKSHQSALDNRCLEMGSSSNKKQTNKIGLCRKKMKI